MLDKAHIAHHLPGRVRIRLPHARRDAKMLEHVCEFISGVDGVYKVEANLLTGSVVIHYDPARESDLHHYLPTPTGLDDAAEIAEKLQRETEFLAEHSQTAASLVSAARALDQGLRAATGGLLDLKVTLPALLAVWAFFEVGLDASTPLWVSLGMFSFNSFVSLHRPVPIRTTMVHETEEPANEPARHA